MLYITVKFSSSDRIYYYESDSSTFKAGDHLLVDNGQTIELAQVASLMTNKAEIASKGASLELGAGEIIRKLTEKDWQKLAEIKGRAREYLPICQERINNYRLSMKLLDADLSFDEKKLTFYFGSEGRVDFRELALDLIRACKKIIRLQQVGSRDEAKIFGGFGSCGRQICCSSFLKNIGSVTVDMAKEQNLSGGVGKISGLCGKLKCCLAFEMENYLELKKRLPVLGKLIKTKDGEGKVVEQNILGQSVRIKLKTGKTVEVEL